MEVDFPTAEIISRLKEQTHGGLSVVNNLMFTVPADTVVNARGLKMPAYLLLVLESEKDEFFAKNKLPDNKTSFYGQYNNETQCYEFDDMRQYLVEMLRKDSEGTLTEADSRFVITPIAVERGQSSASYYYTTTESSILGITPMIALPTMVDLRTQDSKLNLVFSKQSL